MNLIKNIKALFMAKLEHKKFVLLPAERAEGAVDMTQSEIVEALIKYKAQNPLKYEAKKAALFAKYGLEDEEVQAPEPDANDIELKAIKERVTKKAK